VRSAQGDGTQGSYDIRCTVNGGGPMSTADAVVLGLARPADANRLGAALAEHQLLTRDSRKKETQEYAAAAPARVSVFQALSELPAPWPALHSSNIAAARRGGQKRGENFNKLSRQSCRRAQGGADVESNLKLKYAVERRARRTCPGQTSSA